MRLLICLLLTGLAVLPLSAQEAPLVDVPVRYDADLLPPSFHAERRAALLETLPDDAVAVILSAPVRQRENDVDFEYRQNSDLLYLTGMTEPGSVLLLAPAGLPIDGKSATEILLVPSRNTQEEIWTGRRLGPERARDELGIAHTAVLGRFEALLDGALDADRTIYLPALPDGVATDSDLGRQLAVLGRQLRANQIENTHLPRTLTQLRMAKTEHELELLRRAIAITTEAHREAMRSIEPGMHEYEAEALIEYVFHRNGAEHPGFPSIVGSGENSVILHYNTNRRRMQAGDLVVIDIGAEVHGYSADVTRTLPVSGTFSAEQRAIYELVLEAQRAGIAAARAGRAFGAPGQAARRVIADGLARLGLIDDDREVSRFFMHGTSHYLGLWVHDVGDYESLQPNQVITVEPGIYIAPAADIDPKWWNIGVRIEDDVLITPADPVNLSADAPRTVEAVEALMRERGLGNEPAGVVQPATSDGAGPGGR